MQANRRNHCSIRLVTVLRWYGEDDPDLVAQHGDWRTCDSDGFVPAAASTRTHF